VDARCSGVANVFDATRLLHRLLPEPVFDSFPVHVEPAQTEVIALDASESIRLNFSNSGNGALLLGLGWSGLEDWGVWSVGPRSELVFPLKTFSGSLIVAIHGQLFHPPRTLRIRIECETRVLSEQETYVTNEVVALEPIPIDISMTDSEKELRIVLMIDQCGSPAELGLSDDIRKLGFGLHRIGIFVAPGIPSSGVL
jgi:hypothetical protein